MMAFAGRHSRKSPRTSASAIHLRAKPVLKRYEAPLNVALAGGSNPALRSQSAPLTRRLENVQQLRISIGRGPLDGSGLGRHGSRSVACEVSKSSGAPVDFADLWAHCT